MKRSFLFWTTSLSAALISASGRAADPPATAGYPEPVVQWGVQKDETCEDIAKVMYGSAAHVPLIGRYNRVKSADETIQVLGLDD